MAGRSIGSVQNADSILGEVDSLPYQAKTLNEVVKWYANSYPDRIHIRFYSDEGDGESITYKELWINATSIAAGLQYHGFEIGKPIAIMLPTEKEYFFTFFGILLAGGVPVPLYPPARLNLIKDHLNRHCSILNNCKAPLLITIPEAKSFAHLLKSRVATLKGIMTVKDLCQQSESFIELDIGERELAFLQYTSRLKERKLFWKS